MPFMISRRRLEDDFDAWKARFEAGAEERAAAGCRGVLRFRSLDDPKELVTIFDWDTRENAIAFVKRKEGQVPSLTQQRDDGSPKHEYLFFEDLGDLPS